MKWTNVAAVASIASFGLSLYSFLNPQIMTLSLRSFSIFSSLSALGTEIFLGWVFIIIFIAAFGWLLKEEYL